MSGGGMDNSLRKGMVYDKFIQFSSPFNTFFPLSVASLYYSTTWLRFPHITSLGVPYVLFH